MGPFNFWIKCLWTLSQRKGEERATLKRRGRPEGRDQSGRGFVKGLQERGSPPPPHYQYREEGEMKNKTDVTNQLSDNKNRNMFKIPPTDRLMEKFATGSSRLHKGPNQSYHGHQCHVFDVCHWYPHR